MFNELYQLLMERYKRYTTQFKLSDDTDNDARGHANELSWIMIELFGYEKPVEDMERFDKLLDLHREDSRNVQDMDT